MLASYYPTLSGYVSCMLNGQT